MVGFVGIFIALLKDVTSHDALRPRSHQRTTDDGLIARDDIPDGFLHDVFFSIDFVSRSFRGLIARGDFPLATLSRRGVQNRS